MPVPTGVSASATSVTSVTASCDGATDVGTLTYRVEYRVAGSTDAWTVDAEDVTATTDVVDGLTCGTKCEFQVSAKRDVVVALTPWSSPSDTATAVPLTVVDATMTKVGANHVTVTWAYGTGCTGITAARYYIDHAQEYADSTAVRVEFQSAQAPPFPLPMDLAHQTSGSPLVHSRWIRQQILLEADDDVTERLAFDAVGPVAQQDLDEAFRLAVGAGRVGPGAQRVRLVLPQVPTTRASPVRANARLITSWARRLWWTVADMR